MNWVVLLKVFPGGVWGQFVPALAAYYTTDYCRIKVYAVGRHRLSPLIYTGPRGYIVVLILPFNRNTNCDPAEQYESPPQSSLRSGQRLPVELSYIYSLPVCIQ